MPALHGRAEYFMKSKEKEIRIALMNCRSKKLRLRIIHIIKLMNLFGRDLRVQQAVDHAYYIQKQQELETLEERLTESIEKALDYMNKLENCCDQVSLRCRRDYINLRKIIGNTVEVSNK